MDFLKFLVDFVGFWWIFMDLIDFRGILSRLGGVLSRLGRVLDRKSGQHGSNLIPKMEPKW